MTKNTDCLVSKCLIFGVLYLLSSAAIAQQKLESNKYLNRSQLTASPVASGFGTFGNTPVSYFTGTPDIQIPLYEVVYKELSIDLSLRYHQAIGTKPDALPGVTGNGWVLNTGGIITRISRGTTPYNFPDNVPVPVNFNPTSDPNWSSAATMQNHLKNQTVFVNAEGRYDEYSYSFGGRTGKFYIDHTDAFRIKTEQGEDILVEKDPPLAYKEFTMPAEAQLPYSCLATGVAYTNIIKQRNFIYKFTLTDSQGIKYTFGGTDQSIEFTRPGMAYNEFDLKDQNTLPTSWHLTSIESPHGYKMELNYKRDKFYIISETYVSDRIIQPLKFADNENSPKGKIIKSTLYHPCYLDEIVTPVSKVKFNWSIASQQLGYTFNVVNPPVIPGQPDNNCGSVPGDLHSQFHFTKYPEIRDAAITGRFPNKLDNFIVYNSAGVRKKKIDFNYTASTNTRLKLLSVKLGGTSDVPKNIPTYSFEYNPLPLPEYLSFKTDDYGFYNNNNLYITSANPVYYYNLFTNAATRQAYLDSRKPDINFTQAEVLQKVTYPTGGYTEYEFENNEYGRIAKYWPASVQENAGGAVYTGGLRIRRISHYDSPNHKATEKKYFYKLNYATAGASSSGVLSYEPVHFAYFNGAVQAPAKYEGTAAEPNFEGNLTYTQYSTDPLNAHSYKGNHITYSEVAEVDLDGSYKVYKYKNYDNGYHDKPAENMVCDNSNVADFWREDEMNSMELERGQILLEQTYNSSNALKQAIVYGYNDDANRFNSNVRRIKMIPNPIFTANYPSLRYTASLIYTYYPYLKTRTVTNYEQSGNVVNAVTKAYKDSNRLVSSETSTDSKGQSTVVSYKYPDDYPADATSLAMKNKHIIAPVMETKTVVGGTQTNLIQTSYFSPFPNIYVPQDIKVQNGSNPLETRQTFTKYDSKGTLLEQQKPNDVKENYLWGYQSHFLMAKITGSDYAAINASNNQSTLDNAEINEAAVVNTLKQIRTSLAGSNPAAQMTSYTYASLLGINTVTDLNGITIHYQYDPFGRLMSVHNANGPSPGTVRASYCYNYAGQPTDCSTLAPVGSIAAANLALISEEEALPVGLVDFEAVKMENVVLLNWSTASETNSGRFEVERSFNSKNWSKIGSVPAAEESDSLRNYSFTDVDPRPAHALGRDNLYRLKMLDGGSTFAYSRIRSVFFDVNGDVALFPNPVTISDQLHIRISDLSVITQIRIFDTNGKLVLRPALANTIDTRRLEAGLYIVEITYTDGSVSTHRVVRR